MAGNQAPKYIIFGRPVVLSRGYGKADRINGTITGFRCVQAKSSSCSYDILKSCYPDLQDYFYIAEIDIEIKNVEEWCLSTVRKI